MIKNAESLAAVHTQHSNEQTLEAFFSASNNNRN